VDATVARISVNIFLTGVCCIWLEICLKPVGEDLGQLHEYITYTGNPPLDLFQRLILALGELDFADGAYIAYFC